MLHIIARATGRQCWRNDMYQLEVWDPEADEAEHGLRTEFADGIYIVTVHEDTPTDWLDLARRVSVATYEQHPGPDFMPASNYDSAIAVADRRVVGGTLVRLESAPRYNCDRMARPIPLMTYLERKARNAGLRLVRRGNGLRPLIRSGFIPRVEGKGLAEDRKSTRLNSSHPSISYAVFCLKKKKNKREYLK